MKIKVKTLALTALSSAVITLLTVLIPSRADSVQQLKNLTFGKPFAFLYQSSTFTPDRYPLLIRLGSPLEWPTKLHLLPLIQSWLCIFAVLLIILLLIRKRKIQ